MGFSVIVGRIVGANNGHDHINRSDSLAAVFFNNEGNLLEVLVVVRELISLQFHVRGTRIGPVRNSRTAEDDIFRYIIQVGAGTGAVAAHAVLFTVVGL